MNLRALTRGDAAVAGAALLLLIASFLPYRSFSFCVLKTCRTNSTSAWSTDLFPVLPSVFLLGIAAAVLVLLHRSQGEAATGRQILGLRLDQWGTALSLAALWSGLTSLAGGGSAVSNGFGAWLAVLALLVLAGAAAAGPLVPALKAPLLSDKPAPAPQGFQGAPLGYQGPGTTQPGQPGQYDYGFQGGAQQQPPAFGGQPQPQAGGYGYPAPGQAAHDPAPPTQALPPQQPAAPEPTPAPAAPAVDFAPFWFAVPVPRQLAPKDNPAGAPVGELLPGTWYLAVEQRGTALVAQLPDGSHGLLVDVSGIQRG
ncbi:hypothetical protein CFP65_2121 [Kitasatospora sp. MMS16-BH015]|uniref:hypothetical protein n=1 Tax=Kitasatospora sp. MMS16-BH015 TaxID=2018025 RepID=UPI000CA2F4FA|nr:hypothetical protein [Kitasatospora sp. MMS16-BH015]AUG76976.1 hypothetical protein CFP65_2121 [Kitasatospora sp. MMS16-BH015]